MTGVRSVCDLCKDGWVTSRAVRLHVVLWGRIRVGCTMTVVKSSRDVGVRVLRELISSSQTQIKAIYTYSMNGGSCAGESTDK